MPRNAATCGRTRLRLGLCSLCEPTLLCRLSPPRPERHVAFQRTPELWSRGPLKTAAPEWDREVPFRLPRICARSAVESGLASNHSPGGVASQPHPVHEKETGLTPPLHPASSNNGELHSFAGKEIESLRCRPALDLPQLSERDASHLSARSNRGLAQQPRKLLRQERTSPSTMPPKSLHPLRNRESGTPPTGTSRRRMSCRDEWPRPGRGA